MINELKASQAPVSSHKTDQHTVSEKSTADEYFEEIVDMLNEEDSLPETKPYEYAVEDDPDLFNQILALMPKDQIPKVNPRRSSETASQRNAEIDQLAQELSNLAHKENMDITLRNNLENKLQHRKDTYAQAARDELRISAHYQHTLKLVRRISILSPSRRIFAKILNNRALITMRKCNG